MKVDFEPLQVSETEEFITVRQWILCKEDLLILGGDGNWATQTQKSNLSVLKETNPPKWATNVIWRTTST